MAEVPNFVLYEHAVGYALLRVMEFEDIGRAIPEVEESVSDVQRFCSLVKMEAFVAFKNTESAMDNCNCIAEGQVHEDLQNFLEANLPRKKKKIIILGIHDSKLASSISEKIEGVRCQFSGVVPEIMRGIRMHFAKMSKDLAHHSLSKAQLSLGHSYSRRKVKFDIHRVDNMVIQSIALLDQLDKDINLFGMRIREWYSYHFPELFKVVPDQHKYIKCASAVMNRNNLDEKVVASLKEILEDDEKVAELVEAARTSMGMDISELDLLNVERFAKRVSSLTDYRERLHAYIKERMHSCAPSLSALVGEQVGARLISHAGSLTSLAKYPASTVQILGAEKALFRALKTRSNTPKYGLLFHSTFIGRASAKNKGRISRFLANKCSVASRIDCFSEIPVSTYGDHLRQQVEDRLKFLETGEVPKKNIEVMKEAVEEATVLQTKILKKRKKEAKKAKKENKMEISGDLEEVEMPDVQLQDNESTKKRKAESVTAEGDGESKAYQETTDAEPIKKKKKGKHNVSALSENSEIAEESMNITDPHESRKKKKSKENVVDLNIEMQDERKEAEAADRKKGKKKKKNLL